jgi:hypothetical protein
LSPPAMCGRRLRSISGRIEISPPAAV